MGQRSEKILFPGSQGRPLAARLERPLGTARAVALFAHCFTCSQASHAATRITRSLAEHGIAALRFDFTGLGGSEGDFANTDFSSNIADILAAADHLRRNQGGPHLLIGHSLGGTAVLAAAAEIPEARAVVTIGAPADPEHIARLFAPERPTIMREGEAEVMIGGRRFTITRRFLDDLARHPLAERLAGLRKALLVCHAPLDQVVGIENATRIFGAAKHPKSFLSLDDADHLLTRAADARYVATALLAWAERFLPEDQPLAEAMPEPGLVLVEENGEGRFGQDVLIGPHRLRADEPRAVGGLDTGPTPYGYLTAGLGACTAMTLRLYAERKNWPLDHVAVRLHHEKVHEADAAGARGMIDRIAREISLEGALSAEQRARLLEIADRCPVHRTLESRVDIRTRLAPGETEQNTGVTS